MPTTKSVSDSSFLASKPNKNWKVTNVKLHHSSIQSNKQQGNWSLVNIYPLHDSIVVTLSSLVYIPVKFSNCKAKGTGDKAIDLVTSSSLVM